MTTPALATEANGTSFDKTSFVVGDTRRRGTRRVSDTASRTEVSVAAVYASCQPLSPPWLTCSNFRRCHFDRFVGVTEIHLYISFILLGVVDESSKTCSNVEGLICPLPEDYAFQTSVWNQHSRLLSASPSTFGHI